jgi:tetratricopeptide (TPR) repeat protein
MAVASTRTRRPSAAPSSAAAPTLALCALAVVAGCAGSSTDGTPQPERPAERGRELAELRDQDVVLGLPAGTLIELQRSELVAEEVGAFADDPEVRLVDAWLRELLGTSRHFDIAEPRSGSLGRRQPLVDLPVVRVVCAIDSVADVWSTRLERDGEPPLPVASVRGVDEDGEIVPQERLLAELAARTRIALGDSGARFAPMPTPLAVYSREPECVLATERGLRLQRQGSATTARVELENALTIDPGSTLTLASLLAVELELGTEAGEVLRRAQRALQLLDARTSPTTRHRLQRLFWLATSIEAAKSGAERARAVDAKLLELADRDLRDRPFDPHVVYTRALALNNLGRFDESVVLLRALDQRWPKEARVAYNLCFAELATGHPEDALTAIRSAARGLPPGRDVLPRAIALYESGRIDELSTWLGRLERSASVDPASRTVHDVRRMRASLEILRGHAGEAAAFLLHDIAWMRDRPSQLQMLAAELVEAGEVLVLLGYAHELEPMLAAIQDLQLDSPAIGNALIFLSGLVQVAQGDGEPSEAVVQLEQRGARAWQGVLQAAYARSRGDLAEEAANLGGAIQLGDTPLLRARLARALRDLGRTDQADRLLEDLRRRVADLDLRAPLEHPLFQPGLALAVLARTSLAERGAKGESAGR